jgi:hypothetical protein
MGIQIQADNLEINSASHGKTNVTPPLWWRDNLGVTVEDKAAYFRWRRNSIRDNPLKPAKASVVGSGVGVIVY